MPFRIVRNNITHMACDAIVNTANPEPIYSTGCDYAIYTAAGADELLAERAQIGAKEEGEVFYTSAYRLKAKYIIHAVSPLYIDGNHGEEAKLRSCYRKSLQLAKDLEVTSIAFPLISAGGYGYPREQVMRIAMDEIYSFLMEHEMDITLVVFGDNSADLGRKVYPGLKEYIDRNYVEQQLQLEYGYHRQMDANDRPRFAPLLPTVKAPRPMSESPESAKKAKRKRFFSSKPGSQSSAPAEPFDSCMAEESSAPPILPGSSGGLSLGKNFSGNMQDLGRDQYDDVLKKMEKALQERIAHLQDTFSEYLLYLIESKGMTNAEVYNRAYVSKKAFSKIKNNPDAHPLKTTVMSLCVGAKLNLDETRDLMTRAGYALSPCDKTDIIFSFFIENGIYDMIELDLQLEEFGLPTLING